MTEPLDLSVTITEPPQGSASDVVASIGLQCDVLGLFHAGDLLCDVLNQQERDELQWYLEDYWKWPYEGFATRGKRVEAQLADIGKRLFAAVFGSPQARSLVQAWRVQPAARRQISLVSDLPHILNLPWELLHDGQGFLVLQPENPISILRRLPQSERSALSLPFQPPLRVLLVTARPTGVDFIDHRSIAQELVDELHTQVEEEVIELEFLRPPTLAALHARLKDKGRPLHVLHFDGHGVFDEERGREGVLLFETEIGWPRPVKASDLAKVLRDSGVHLAVLTACQSAVSAANDALSSVATQLIGSGMDAVVAMSASFLVASATRYTEVFYRELAGGASAPAAQELARQALHDDPRRHVHRRRKDEEGHPVELRDWWVPHFYQQHPLKLQAIGPPRKSQAQQSAGLTSRLNANLPPEPRCGFRGRARELLQIERWLRQGKPVLIRGFGGIGKTALVGEAADWLTRTGMYDGALFVSFERGGDTATLLSALNTYLNASDDHDNPHGTATALTHLKPVLEKRRILVVADSLEAIVPGAGDPARAPIADELSAVFLELVQMGAGALLTSRDPTFGDGQLAPGKRVEQLELRGLHPEDAYTLAVHVLQDLGIDLQQVPYADLQDLLKRLDYHPLAVQLVLPLLRGVPLADLSDNLAALLPAFVDNTLGGRNRSLLASLEYSLQRLGAEQHALLPRLAIFEGGAMEAEVQMITEIFEDEWARLRSTLEQAALVRVEWVPGVVNFPFLRFHPLLIPYLRCQPGADDPALRSRYTHRYYALIHLLITQETITPEPVWAQVQRELPNLRRTLELILEEGAMDAARAMVTYLGHFLKIFGLARERDILMRRVTRAPASASEGGGHSFAEFLHEYDLGRDEWNMGRLSAALTRYSNLLARIEALPEGTEVGRGSNAHYETLWMVARCLIDSGQPADAEEKIREVMPQIDLESDQKTRGELLRNLGAALFARGKYAEAEEAYDEEWRIAESQGDMRAQTSAAERLGEVARLQRNFAKARYCYTVVVDLCQMLGEPEGETVGWHQLGIIAQAQEEWAEAERCYRKSLVLDEHLGDAAGAAMTCNQLAVMAQHTGRPSEAESWYKRALELDEPGSLSQAVHLSNLADMLVNEVESGHLQHARLAGAQNYAEQAVAITGKMDASAGVWLALRTLARIAELGGRAEEAQVYRRRERETYADFAGNRYQVDRQHRRLIAFIVASAYGDEEARAGCEAFLSKLEDDDDVERRRTAAAVRRIWQGERDWSALTADLKNPGNTLLILQVLEIFLIDELAQSDWDKGAQILTAHADVLLSERIESALDTLTTTIRDGDAIIRLEKVRTLLRRCRTWGIAPVRYLETELHMHINSIAIPSEYEPAVMQIATLLLPQQEDDRALEAASEDLQALLDDIAKETADIPYLFEAALLRLLADVMLQLPTTYTDGKLVKVEALYRKALPTYKAADLTQDVALLQYSLGGVLIEQGRDEQALEVLQEAIQTWRTDEQCKNEAVWALSQYASALGRLGRIEEALAAYAEAIHLIPEAALYRSRAETLINARRLTEAEADLACAIDLDGNEESPYLWHRRAQAAIARGEGARAEQLIGEITGRDASFDVALLQAQNAWLQEDMHTAQEVLQKAWEEANPERRLVMRRDFERLFGEHPGLAGKDALWNIMQ